MSKELVSISGFKDFVAQVKKVCLAHLAVASFESGNDAEEVSNPSYPLVYLDATNEATTAKVLESRTVTLTVMDRADSEAEDDYIKAQDKIESIVDDIVIELNRFFFQVSDSNKLTYRNFNNDRAVTCIAEFTITYARTAPKLNRPFSY